MSCSLKVTIEYDGHWYDYTVQHDNRELMGCSRSMEGAMHAAYEAYETIQKPVKNPRRNP